MHGVPPMRHPTSTRNSAVARGPSACRCSTPRCKRRRARGSRWTMTYCAAGLGGSMLAAWREAGGSHISVVTMGANLTTIDGHIEAIRRWRDVYNSVR
jgi:hypothetical protein